MKNKQNNHQKSPFWRDFFDSVEGSFAENLCQLGCLHPNTENINCQVSEIAQESRRRDLHPHLLTDKKGILLHELRRQMASRAKLLKQKMENETMEGL